MCYYFSHSWIGLHLSTHTVIITSEHTKVFIPGLPKTVSPVFSSPGLLVEVREGWMGLAKVAYVSLPNPWFWLVVNLPFPCGHHWPGLLSLPLLFRVSVLAYYIPDIPIYWLVHTIVHPLFEYHPMGPSRMHVWNELITSCDRVVHLRVYHHIPHSSNI